MTRKEVLDLYFLDARSRVIDVAAFFDRLDRAEGAEDFRLEALREAIRILVDGKPERARRILTALSDPTQFPIPAATTQGACGAWQGKE